MKKAEISNALLTEGRAYAQEILKGLTAGTSHFHAVKYMKDKLAGAGFTEIQEQDKWSLTPGKSYFLTRNQSSIIAFTLGTKTAGGIEFFKSIGCHTDSPVIKLAPHSKVDNKLGYQQLNIQTYGGGLWRTWFDRDLGLAGKVCYIDTDGKLTSALWDSKSAVMNIPSLCIHLAREPEFNPNKETHLKPILATHVVDQLMGESIKPFADKQDIYQVEQKHFATFLDRIASDMGLTVDQIVDFEFAAYDAHRPALFGLHNEFVASPRLDNLASSLCSLDSLIDYSKETHEDNEVAMILLFDHEEVGSRSATGADSNMVGESMERVVLATVANSTKEDYYRTVKKSFFISADMAHAVHPNYSEKHQAAHHPKIHEGIVLKFNANQRYMTDSASAALLRVLAANAEPAVPIQDFIVKQDGACGSTIGPAVAASCGIKTIDIGAPQLSMHSIRETCGVVDLLYYQKLFAVFFKSYGSLS